MIRPVTRPPRWRPSRAIEQDRGTPCDCAGRALADSGDEGKPAIAAIGASGPTIEVDIELTGGYGALPADGLTIRTEPLVMTTPPPRRRTALWIVLAILALAIASAIAVFALR